jgi:outer membrane lipoprotein-sorting protein
LINLKRKSGLMGKRSISLFLFIFLGVANTLYAGESIPEILQGIRNHYGTLPGLTVHYEREIVTRSMAMLDAQMKGDLATGLIHFKPPHYLKVEQKTPKTEYVISDGKVLWWYIPDKALAYRYPSKKLGKELQVLSDTFQGLKHAEENFKITMKEIEGKGYLLNLIPDPPWQQVEHIGLLVDPEEYRIRMIAIYNYVGGITRFMLKKLSVRHDLEERSFQFKAPDGVKVLEEN